MGGSGLLAPQFLGALDPLPWSGSFPAGSAIISFVFWRNYPRVAPDKYRILAALSRWGAMNGYRVCILPPKKPGSRSCVNISFFFL